MILHINFTGGMGVSYQGRLDLSDLPEDILKQVRSKLSEKMLAKMSDQEKNPFMTDSMIYEFQYQDSRRKYCINESQADGEMMDLMDILRPFIKLQPKTVDPQK